jgi:hypothetical protein
MAQYNVTAPDGSVYKYTVPDDVTQDQVLAHAQENHPAPQQADGPGFYDRSVMNFQKRLDEGQNAADSYVSGQQSLPLTYLDFAGKIGAGTGTDLIKEGINSAASYIPQGAKDAVSTGLHYLSDSPPGRLAADAAHYVGGQYQDIAQRFPNAARHVEAVADIGSLLAPELPVKGTSLANSAVDAASQGAGAVGREAADLAAALNTKTIRPTAADLASAAKENYARVENSGAVLSPQLTNGIIDHANSFAIKDPMAAKIAGESPLAKISADLEEHRDQPMTLQRAEAVDKALTDRLEDSAFTDKNGVLNNYGRQLLDIKNNLRTSMLDAEKNGHVIGGESGDVSAYMDAVKDWAREKPNQRNSAHH